MNLRLKDYVAIAIVTFASFPILYFVVLFATGAVRLEFGAKEKPAEEKKNIAVMRQSARKDSLAEVNSRTFQALQIERQELEKERKRLFEQQQRTDLLQSELDTRYAEIQQERNRLEVLVEKNDTLDTKRIRQLSKMYAAMRPAEAAQIIETLNDAMAAKVIAGISDDRQKAKILSGLSREKASRISKVIGSPDR